MLGLIDLLFFANVRNEEYTYPPSHCWYYKTNTPLAVVDIEPALPPFFGFDKIPKDPKKRYETYRTMLRENEKRLLERVDRYNELLRGEYKPEPWLDTEEDKYMEECTAFSLVHNHISYYKGILIYIVLRASDEFGEKSLELHTP